MKLVLSSAPHFRRRRRFALLLALGLVVVLVLAVTRVLAPEQPPGPVDPDLPSEPRAVAADTEPEVLPDPPRIYPHGFTAGGSSEVPATRTTPGPVDGPRERLTGFRESSIELHPILVGYRPYESGRVRPVPFGTVDAEGVRVMPGEAFSSPAFPQTGSFDHPVAQAQYALAALESYRLTEDEDYRVVAERNAQRIIDRRHEIGDAWYFPYDFQFDLYRNERGVLEPPWASGMASGQALSVFARLYEVTGEERWREAAESTFNAFLQAPDGQGYFVAFVDDDGLLWLEEYPRYPVENSERVLNGHMWSMFGLWDYWAMHGYDQADAESLLRGAFLTLEETGADLFRQAGGPSLYSVWQQRTAETYHVYHQHQFLMLYRMTHDPFWVDLAGRYRDDWPDFRASGEAVISGEVEQVYRLDDGADHISDRSMEIEETADVAELTDPSHLASQVVEFDRRGRIPEGPRVLRVSSGPLTGWWVEEGEDGAWSTSPEDLHPYLPEARLVADGEVALTLYPEVDTLEEAGEELALSPGETIAVDLSGYVHGELSYRIAEGEHTGEWFRAAPELAVEMP